MILSTHAKEDRGLLERVGSRGRVSGTASFVTHMQMASLDARFHNPL